MSGGWFHLTVIYYFHGREFGFTRRFITLGLPRCREVGFTQRLYIISTVVRLGLPNGLCIIIIITTTPFDVEGREVGVPRFMMGIWYGTSLVYMV